MANARVGKTSHLEIVSWLYRASHADHALHAVTWAHSLGIELFPSYAVRDAFLVDDTIYWDPRVSDAVMNESVLREIARWLLGRFGRGVDTTAAVALACAINSHGARRSRLRLAYDASLEASAGGSRGAPSPDEPAAHQRKSGALQEQPRARPRSWDSHPSAQPLPRP